MGNIILLIMSVLIVILALFVVFAKQPITSALSLILMMVLLAGVYALIGAHFVAAIQLIVYAGAIMVLFVFSIMLLNQNDVKKEIDLGKPKTIIGLISALVFAGVLSSLFMKVVTPIKSNQGVFTVETIKALGGNIQALSELLFAEYFIHFEVLSLLLLVAVIGAIVVAKRSVHDHFSQSTKRKVR